MLAWLALLIGALGATAYLFQLLRGRHTQLPVTIQGPTGEFPVEPAATTAIIPFTTPEIIEARADYYRLAFGVKRLDYRILSPHDEVLARVAGLLSTAISEQRHFPRKPALLPKLLRAMNDKGSGLTEIARLILQDAMLAGNVLKRANSSYYRSHDGGAIESVERAVTLLGIDGLRAPVAAAVMQPVFKTPAGFFEQFAPMTWQLTHNSAVAAEHFARSHGGGDPFIAHLAALLSGLGRIVLFRIVLDTYREHSNVLPRAEVFVQAMMSHQLTMSREIARNWEMSDNFVAAIEAQEQQQLPMQMTPLARALYYGELAGLVCLLVQQDVRTHEVGVALLAQQGLDAATIDAISKSLAQEQNK